MYTSDCKAAEEEWEAATAAVEGVREEPIPEEEQPSELVASALYSNMRTYEQRKTLKGHVQLYFHTISLWYPQRQRIALPKTSRPDLAVCLGQPSMEASSLAHLLPRWGLCPREK